MLHYLYYDSNIKNSTTHKWSNAHCKLPILKIVFFKMHRVYFTLDAPVFLLYYETAYLIWFHHRGLFLNHVINQTTSGTLWVLMGQPMSSWDPFIIYFWPKKEGVSFLSQGTVAHICTAHCSHIQVFFVCLCLYY